MSTAELKKQIRGEFENLLLKYAGMLAWYDRELHKIFEPEDGSGVNVSAGVDTSLFVKALTKLDDDFAEKEFTFYKEYRRILQKYHKKLQIAEQKEELEMAIASLQNRLRLTISLVSEDAADKLEQAKLLGVSGKPIARMEFLAELTLAKQMDFFNSIFGEFG